MDLDKLRNNYKAKRRESNKSIDSQCVKDSASAHNKIADMSETSDISVAFISNSNFYFCFGETGQKLKIPMSYFIDNEGYLLSVDRIVDKIDSMQISASNRTSEDLSVYNFGKSFPSILKSADRIFILYTPNIQSWLNAMDMFEDYRDIVPSRLISESNIAAFGAVVKNANRETNHKYEYRDCRLDVNTGDGVIEIGDSIKPFEYVVPSIKDIIKGCVIQSKIIDGSIREVLFLSATSFNLNIVVYENELVRDVKLGIVKNVTLPTRRIIDLYLESNQKVVVEIDNIVVTTDISQCFDVISYVQIDVTEDILIHGKKGKKNVSLSLSTLMHTCPR